MSQKRKQTAVRCRQFDLRVHVCCRCTCSTKILYSMRQVSCFKGWSNTYSDARRELLLLDYVQELLAKQILFRKLYFGNLRNDLFRNLKNICTVTCCRNTCTCIRMCGYFSRHICRLNVRIYLIAWYTAMVNCLCACVY